MKQKVLTSIEQTGTCSTYKAIYSIKFGLFQRNREKKGKGTREKGRGKGKRDEGKGKRDEGSIFLLVNIKKLIYKKLHMTMASHTHKQYNGNS